MNAFCTMQGWWATWFSILPGNLEAAFLPLLDEGRGSSAVLLQLGWKVLGAQRLEGW